MGVAQTTSLLPMASRMRVVMHPPRHVTSQGTAAAPMESQRLPVRSQSLIGQSPIAHYQIE